MVLVLRNGVARWRKAMLVTLTSLSLGAPLSRAEDSVIQLTPEATLAPVDNSGVALESVGGEVISERYPNRVVKIERHVVRDVNGDYVNHGPWIMYDERGGEMGHGSFRNDLRQGLWTRIFHEGEADMLSGSWGKLFTAPFVSTASFEEDQMHGAWTVVDAQDRPVGVWEYDHGTRHGKSVWFFPDGQKWRECHYKHGELDGEFVEWATDGSQVSREIYHDGRREEVRREWFAPGQLKAEAHYLSAKEKTQITDDWWAGVRSTKSLAVEKDELRHGMWTSYYKNGQKAMEGEFDNDIPKGTFAWWHPNGQRAIEGTYADGLQHGRWSWWYASGKRFLQGSYEEGRQTGDWTRWNITGEVAENVSYNDVSASEVAEAFRDREVVEPAPEAVNTMRTISERRIQVVQPRDDQ
jgi:antitoxin component YwqK of YwqJK toxin-antitoxin module